MLRASKLQVINTMGSADEAALPPTAMTRPEPVAMPFSEPGYIMIALGLV
jgi:hypothetical protein